jgi:hypothetical protein
MIRVLGTIIAGLLGLAFGSFLNVCLSRWPAGESIVHPRSHCMSCGERSSGGKMCRWRVGWRCAGAAGAAARGLAGAIRWSSWR